MKDTALEQRLQKLEDELAVRNVIVRYGLAADAGDIEAARALFTDDTVYECGAPDTGRSDDEGFAQDTLTMEGLNAILSMLQGPQHQSMLPNCAHTNGPLDVSVNGLEARATGYSRLYLREGEDFRLLRVAVNTWHLRKQEGQWKISYRLSQPVGTTATQQLLKDSLA